MGQTTATAAMAVTVVMAKAAKTAISIKTYQ